MSETDMDRLSNSRLKVTKLHTDAVLPKMQSEQSAGYDLTAIEDYKIPARGSATVRTGVAMQIPNGLYGRISSRSGLAVKHKLEVGAGTIDRDYRGEIIVLLHNHSDSDYLLQKGDRCAQIIFTYYATLDIVLDTLEETNRGVNGFGSTGI